VERLPEMSLIFYPEDDDATYVLVEPADPFTEAIRTGLEIGAEIVFADPEAGDRPHLPDAYPDPYAIRAIGLERFVEAYRVYPQPRSRRSPAMPPASPGNSKAPTRRPACSWWSRSICSIRCSTPWRSRRRSPFRAHAARTSSSSTRTRIRSLKSPSNIRSFSGVMRTTAPR